MLCNWSNWLKVEQREKEELHVRLHKRREGFWKAWNWEKKEREERRPLNFKVKFSIRRSWQWKKKKANSTNTTQWEQALRKRRLWKTWQGWPLELELSLDDEEEEFWMENYLKVKFSIRRFSRQWDDHSFWPEHWFKEITSNCDRVEKTNLLAGTSSQKIGGVLTCYRSWKKVR